VGKMAHSLPRLVGDEPETDDMGVLSYPPFTERRGRLAVVNVDVALTMAVKVCRASRGNAFTSMCTKSRT
jgi:hypothetical protein